ncbi:MULTISPECIES: DUF6906 family protein [Listeria]|uniref:DUF6906 family protein n=2 Tax=Listeria TaxID=1637 RepID=UPI001774BE3F|nr:hypothetical protein [Listeria monocytogenes]EIS7442843.1 hypothetical protein [Listeria monocytogenes]EIS7575682.1 hypothetical protein [Listeria monocytogenes]EIS7643200.1 hypothetical protein [Listeria monocytogenes]EKL4566842.1 hypothetical protein [Listeria monocytogenes]
MMQIRDIRGDAKIARKIIMKNGKKLTRNQATMIKSNGLNPENWLVVKNLNDRMEIVHREKGSKRVIYK